MNDSSQKDVQTIGEIREQTMHPENTGDTGFFDSACTDDVVVMPPNMQR